MQLTHSVSIDHPKTNSTLIMTTTSLLSCKLSESEGGLTGGIITFDCFTPLDASFFNFFK